jgi:hypothetical protein
MREPGYQVDLANAYPYDMQFMPSMAGGWWEKWYEQSLTCQIDQEDNRASCILSIFRVRFNFYVDAPFYALPYRLPDNAILYPRMGYGYYMRDDVLNALDWCKKYKIPVDKAVIIEEANFFHPAPDAVQVPFALLQDIYVKRIEFDKKDPKGPEQSVLKTGMCSCYGKLAERRFRGIDPMGNPVIPPHVCPWIASAITAHTRRELMKVALIAPECVIGFATDAIYLETLLPNIPRLKAEDDIKAGKEEKLLGDWCWAKVPAAVFIQSGLTLSLDEEGKVAEVKCRGIPIKKKEKAQKFPDDVLEAWKRHTTQRASTNSATRPDLPDAMLPFRYMPSCPYIRQSSRRRNSAISSANGVMSPKQYGLTTLAANVPSTNMSWIILGKRQSQLHRRKTLRLISFPRYASPIGSRMR